MLIPTEIIDTTEISNLIRKARGTTSNQEFASMLAVSPSYISRLVNNKSGNLPSRDLLIKIASIAQNNVTLDQLLVASGYPPLHDGETVDVPKGETKFIPATILTALQSLNMAWSNEVVTKPFDLSISFNQGAIKNWHFLYLNYTNTDIQSSQLKARYVDLVFANLTPNDKISFVTSYPEEFELYKSRLPENLNLNLSVILIDEKKLTVQKEEWLHTTSTLPAEALSSYLLK